MKIEFTAADMPRKSIGHFGYFRKTNQPIWQDILEKLEGFK